MNNLANNSLAIEMGLVEVVETHQPHLSDLGNAMRFVAQHGENVRYVHEWNKWIVWNGVRWAVDKNGHISRLARDTVRSIYYDAANITEREVREKTAKHALASESRKHLEDMVKLAKDENGITISADALDSNIFLLNARNGTIDLRTGLLLPHDRRNLITKLVDVDYNPDAQCPLWQSFLVRIMGGNTDMVSFIQRALGYTLTGDTSEQCLFFLYGTGKNGKSTFSETVKAVLGDYSQKAPAQALMAKVNGGSGAQPEVARMVGARFVLASEIEQGARLGESLVKDLTGSDTMAARKLYEDVFEFKPTHKLWIYGNHKPVIRGSDPGIWRRIQLVPFTQFIPPDERIFNLAEKLNAELAGILAWCVVGCLEWQRHGLNTPQEVTTATASYKDEMDVLGGFIDQCCVLNTNASVNATSLYTEYRRWCELTGEYAHPQKTFMLQMVERGVERKRKTSGIDKGKYFWFGIGLVSNEHYDAEQVNTSSEAVKSSEAILGKNPHEEEKIETYPKTTSPRFTASPAAECLGITDDELEALIEAAA